MYTPPTGMFGERTSANGVKRSCIDMQRGRRNKHTFFNVAFANSRSRSCLTAL